ncbi:MAG: PIG-L family deacetylase [Planctomycetes bacterium]|nr:PIG-L family deacetylase [Planctomycetota bacterium]
MSETAAGRAGDPGRGRVLCFAPHPDDEVLGAGGTLLRHVRRGDPVRVVIATDGAAGDPDRRFDPARYTEMRRDESRAAAQLLGWGEPRFWGLPDSCVVVETDKVRLVSLVTEELSAFAPDLVYLPWAGDHNSDHLVLHEVVVRALVAVGFGGSAFGYEVWAPNPQPDLVVDITDLVDDKRAGLRCFATQNAYNDLAHAVFGLNAYRSLLLERSGGFGEALTRVS